MASAIRSPRSGRPGSETTAAASDRAADKAAAAWLNGLRGRRSSGSRGLPERRDPGFDEPAGRAGSALEHDHAVMEGFERPAVPNADQGGPRQQRLQAAIDLGLLPLVQRGGGLV